VHGVHVHVIGSDERRDQKKDLIFAISICGTHHQDGDESIVLKEVDRERGEPVEEEGRGERGWERLERVERGEDEDEEKRNRSKDQCKDCGSERGERSVRKVTKIKDCLTECESIDTKILTGV
jgi:hypothetical protein